MREPTIGERLQASAAAWRVQAAESGPKYAAECERMAMRAERLASQLECEAQLRETEQQLAAIEYGRLAAGV